MSKREGTEQFEQLDNRVDKLAEDMGEVLELYQYAEKLYPYHHLRENKAVRGNLLKIKR
jgi:hypothetical protein